MAQPRLKHFGWGREGEGITPEEEAFVWARIKERFRIDEFAEVKPPRLDERQATSSRVHFATLYTHIDDLVESLRVVPPRAAIQTRRQTGSGAGPTPDRLLIGSESILGIITEAWVRLQARPHFRAGGPV